VLNWLVIGIGDITTRRVIPAILAESRSRLYGLVTRDPQKAVRYPGVRVWTQLAPALEDAAVDIVYVASPVALHAPQTMAALRAAKHVLCEKPVAMNYPEAVSVASVAAQSRGICGVSYYRRLFPKLIRAKELMAAGAIGQPVLAEANNHGWLDIGSRDWLLDPTLAGGGPLYDTASHRIDAFNFLFGRPVRATGMRANVVHKLDVEDAATVLVEYGNKLRGIVDVRWNTHLRRDQFRITGTDGEIDLDPLSGPSIRCNGHAEDLACHTNVHYPVVEDFATAVLEHRPPVCPIEDAIGTDWVTSEAMR
jgi:1,5-anhydro-D-fructose reductase (1,5-anhydro-D-mannitol-forming)